MCSKIWIARTLLWLLSLTCLTRGSVLFSQQSNPQFHGNQAGLEGPTAQASKLPVATLKRIDSKHLPNLVEVNEKVLSGGLPDSEEAFTELQKLGVRTVISVDAAKPMVEQAARVGIRYVHLPHGYDQVPELRGRQLAKAISTLPGRIYIHCHHGKHRSPAATAVGCLNLGWLNRDQAANLLKLAGTDPKYRGLFRSLDQATLLHPSTLATVESDFPEVADLHPMASSMVELERLFDELQQSRKNKWQAVSHGKDALPRSPQQSALLLQEQFRELLRLDDARCREDKFKQLTEESERASAEIERLLSSNVLTSRNRQSPAMIAAIEQLDQALLRIENNCKSCHDAVRN